MKSNRGTNHFVHSGSPADRVRAGMFRRIGLEDLLKPTLC